MITANAIRTDNVQHDRMADGRRRRDLALVDAGVFLLGVPNAQRPLLGVRRVQRLEALVRGVRVASDRQQVDVAMSHPRDLYVNKTITIKTGAFELCAPCNFLICVRVIFDLRAKCPEWICTLNGCNLCAACEHTKHQMKYTHTHAQKKGSITQPSSRYMDLFIRFDVSVHRTNGVIIL